MTKKKKLSKKKQESLDKALFNLSVNYFNNINNQPRNSAYYECLEYLKDEVLDRHDLKTLKMMDERLRFFAEEVLEKIALIQRICEHKVKELYKSGKK